MEAKKTIIELISNKVAVMNNINTETDTEAFERFRHELMGMMICLKNIANDGRFYNINYLESGLVFGYYDENGRWFTIKK